MISRLVVFIAALVIFAYASCVSPQKKDDENALKCEILVNIPNPLNVRLINTTNSPYEFSTFQSTHTTMPPMPNMRIEARNRTTGQVKSCIPVVLGEKRKTFRLQAGEMVGLAIYHRGLKLTPGDYEIVVLFYRDDDIEQKIPVVVSKPLLVNVPPEPKTDGKVKPNPFGPEAWLPYKVTKFADVTIKIYDKSGNLVRTADLGKKRPGEYFTKELAFQWDGRNDDGKKLPGGVYFCAIEENGEITSTRKTVILK